MKRSATFVRLLLTAAMAVPATCMAAEETKFVEPRGSFLLAEIVVPTQPDSAQKTRKSATEARSKAKAYTESGSGTPVIVVVPEEEEEGLLGPRRQVESGASQNRAKARQYQQGQTPAQATIPGTLDSAGATPGTADRAKENRAKARSYVSTDNTVVIERIGADGIPIVACGKLVSNDAGRIGDDMQPGSIFFIMRDNKPFKVRCAQ